jgi:UDP-N-acetylmuramoylalanine--D-glutamate ligase
MNIVVMGLGRFGGGVGVTRFLVARGHHVLVTDQLKADDLARSVAQLQDLPAGSVEFRLGEHREDDFRRADLVVVNPAVDPRGNAYLQAAQAAGVKLTSEIRLLVEHLPASLRPHTVGITGSAGKSTTTAMIGHALRAIAGESHVHVGGNLGGSLLNSLDSFGPGDYVVLELSSFMLEGLGEDRWSPHVAVVTNLTANHLDRHGTMENYAAAKRQILAHQRAGDVAILGQGVADWPLNPGVTRRVVPVREYGFDLLIPGEHNQFNAACAAAVVEALGLDGARVAPALADFPGLAHRLQFVAEHSGVRYYNDSKATTPQATELALRSFPPGKVHIILGGYDKGSDLSDLARFAAGHARAIYTIGVTGDRIADAAPGSGPASASGSKATVHRCGTLDAALGRMAGQLHRGDVVLLSTACASWDQFDNYEQRGARFVEAVLKVTGEGAPIPR